MTPTRLRECLDALGWSQRHFARVIDFQEGVVRQWARGADEIPECVADWVEAVMDATARLKRELDG